MLTELATQTIGSGPLRADPNEEGIAGVLSEQADGWGYQPNLGAGRFGPRELLPGGGGSLPART
jgi:hypothetical protein